MSTSGGHFQGAFGMLLSSDVGQVNTPKQTRALNSLTGCPAIAAGIDRGYGAYLELSSQVSRQTGQVADRDHFHSIHQSRLLGIGGRHEYRIVSLVAGYHHHGKHTVCVPEAAVQ